MRYMKRYIIVVWLVSLAGAVWSEKSDSAIIADFLNGVPELYKKVYSSRVLPADSADASVVCDLSIHADSLRAGSAALLVLECDHRPDDDPPMISVNGQSIRPRSNSSSTAYCNGEVTNSYRYFYPMRLATDGRYEFRCEGLSFNSIAYDRGTVILDILPSGYTANTCFEPSSSKTNRVWIVLGIVAFWVMAEWFLFWLCFHKEGDEPLADFVLRTRRLALPVSWAVTHYAMPSLMVLILFGMLVFNLFSLIYDWGVLLPLWAFCVPLLLALVLFRVQRNRLDFEVVPSRLSVEEIRDLFVELAETHGWSIDHLGHDCIVAHTNPSIWSPTWGEQIFVVYDRGQVWLNSVNDLDKRSSIVSFGYTRRNVRRVVEAIRAREQAGDIAR